ncbi:DNA repair protein [Jannaschia sp. S6380]|uniref:DNA repair protein n=1 Tax=Jannaschia sp. S6380 TaxID=2926408 RepID=UPI001FF1D574|nr:DNA repair protein [Jannaschia sp. S6380]MCK0166857.1 DNA repair protein [Jannaschia sp. S6380]
MNDTSRNVAIATSLLQQVCSFLLILAALALTALTAAAAAGMMPWPDIPVALGGAEVAQAGMFTQIGLTLILLILVGFLPANSRMRRLELTNRDFHLSMDDVTRAYAAVHAADRQSTFQLSREFDAMRDRIEWMRNHPELADMEHDVLQVAAQMSVESRDLAEIYSDEKVDRARSFLRQRQQEVEDYRQRISMAQATVQEIKRWMQAVSVEEGLAEKQLERLQKDLAEVTDALKLTGHDRAQNVVGIERPRRKGRAGEAVATPAE